MPTKGQRIAGRVLAAVMAPLLPLIVYANLRGDETFLKEFFRMGRGWFRTLKTGDMQ